MTECVCGETSTRNCPVHGNGEPEGPTEMQRLADCVAWMDADLDEHVSPAYKEQPLAQDWARVAKAVGEVGEAIDALGGYTGQNPRKGTYGSQSDLLTELSDGALTCIYALQHFTKNAATTMDILLSRAEHHVQRRKEQLGGEVDLGETHDI
ncbi:MAG: MazG-like family protein [Acidimicrobiales bacterium]